LDQAKSWRRARRLAWAIDADQLVSHFDRGFDGCMDSFRQSHMIGVNSATRHAAVGCDPLPMKVEKVATIVRHEDLIFSRTAAKPEPPNRARMGSLSLRPTR
jgi:hypothetical protein